MEQLFLAIATWFVALHGDMDPVTIVSTWFTATFILWIMFVNVMFIKNKLLVKYLE